MSTILGAEMTGDELHLWRQRMGWSRGDLMRELGVGSRQTIINWENSDSIPRTVELAIAALEFLPQFRKIGATEETKRSNSEVSARQHAILKRRGKM